MVAHKQHIWDLPVRIFHWGLVISVIGAFITGKAELMSLHERFALTALGLLIFRFFWGFWGGKTARFSHFLASPVAAWSEVVTIKRREKKQHFGHTALSGYAVYALLIVPLLLVITGMFSTDDVLFDGPLAHLAPDMIKQATSWHHNLHPVMVALFILHLAAMLIYRMRLKINLLTPMITGQSLKASQQMPALTASHQVLGLALMAGSIGLAHMIPLLRPSLF